MVGEEDASVIRTWKYGDPRVADDNVLQVGLLAACSAIGLHSVTMIAACT
jgi:hypothetical protein